MQSTPSRCSSSVFKAAAICSLVTDAHWSGVLCFASVQAASNFERESNAVVEMHVTMFGFPLQRHWRQAPRAERSSSPGRAHLELQSIILRSFLEHSLGLVQI